MNGDVNVAIARLFSSLRMSKSANQNARFVFISSAEFNFPSFILSGYFEGKKKTEMAVSQLFGINGNINCNNLSLM